MTEKKKHYDLYLKKIHQEKAAKLTSNSDNKSKAAWDMINQERSAKGRKIQTKPHSLFKVGKKVQDPQKNC